MEAELLASQIGENSMNSKVISHISDSRFDGIFYPMDTSVTLFDKFGHSVIEELLNGIS